MLIYTLIGMLYLSKSMSLLMMYVHNIQGSTEYSGSGSFRAEYPLLGLGSDSVNLKMPKLGLGSARD